MYRYNKTAITVQKLKFSIKGFFSKCDQIRTFLRIGSHLLKKSLMENFIFCAVNIEIYEFYLNLTKKAARVKSVLCFSDFSAFVEQLSHITALLLLLNWNVFVLFVQGEELTFIFPR